MGNPKGSPRGSPVPGPSPWCPPRRRPPASAHRSCGGGRRRLGFRTLRSAPGTAPPRPAPSSRPGGTPWRAAYTRPLCPPGTRWGPRPGCRSAWWLGSGERFTPTSSRSEGRSNAVGGGCCSRRRGVGTRPTRTPLPSKRYLRVSSGSGRQSALDGACPGRTARSLDHRRGQLGQGAAEPAIHPHILAMQTQPHTSPN
jgi:hypothetical protein